jgi:predicted dehydrogenase
VSAEPRREFLRSAGLAALAGGLARVQAPVPALGDAEIRIALVGCGGRGIGAAAQALRTRGRSRLTALADAFPDRLDLAADALRKQFGDRAVVPPEARFSGFEAAERAIALADVVLLAAPPGFRPAHFEAAVRAGRHAYLEPPVAVDAPGVRRVIAAAEQGRARGLKALTGFPRREQNAWRECVDRLREGLMGDLLAGRLYANDGGVWVRQREAGMTEMEYQVRNWYYFVWTGGDPVVEQLCHALDVFRWLTGVLPSHCNAQGGRQVRTGKEFGEIFDHHFLEYDYADGRVLHAQCRQIKNTFSRNAEQVLGTRGRAVIGREIVDHADEALWRFSGANNDPFQSAQDRLFSAIREGTPLHDAEDAALSTQCAILGRMASYSGKRVSWEEAWDSRLTYQPTTLSWEAMPRSRPDPNGNYAHPLPGSTVAW